MKVIQPHGDLVCQECVILAAGCGQQEVLEAVTSAQRAVMDRLASQAPDRVLTPYCRSLLYSVLVLPNAGNNVGLLFRNPPSRINVCLPYPTGALNSHGQNQNNFYFLPISIFMQKL